jgi:hypothetical protein
MVVSIGKGLLLRAFFNLKVVVALLKGYAQKLEEACRSGSFSFFMNLFFFFLWLKVCM